MISVIDMERERERTGRVPSGTPRAVVSTQQKAELVNRLTNPELYKPSIGLPGCDRLAQLGLDEVLTLYSVDLLNLKTLV